MQSFQQDLASMAVVNLVTCSSGEPKLKQLCSFFFPEMEAFIVATACFHNMTVV